MLSRKTMKRAIVAYQNAIEAMPEEEDGYLGPG